jgi:dTDP-4-dehydrorhamnose reductase
MQKVLVLGSTGMLGSMVAQVASKEFDVYEMNRTGKSSITSGKTAVLDLAKPLAIRDFISGNQITSVINCVGLIKQKIQADSQLSIRAAIVTNAIFPSYLAEISDELRIQTLQIATDCVFSGEKGNYSETDHHDATDIYGKSKSLGEICSERMHYFRTSIIGKERDTSSSLLDWVLSQKDSVSINGYSNHSWNGITTLAFAKIVSGALNKENLSNTLQHIVPANRVSKFELVSNIVTVFMEDSVKVIETNALEEIDRTLMTCHEDENQKYWVEAGYNEIPTIDFLVRELREWLASHKK